jgi:hypothetical protein
VGADFTRSLGHDLYFLGVAGVGAMIFWLDRASVDLSRRLLFVAFFFVFAVLQVSPVVASRFSPFFLIPLLLQTDVRPALVEPRAGALLRVMLPIAVGALFIADFLGVLVRDGG